MNTFSLTEKRLQTLPSGTYAIFKNQILHETIVINNNEVPNTSYCLMVVVGSHEMYSAQNYISVRCSEDGLYEITGIENLSYFNDIYILELIIRILPVWFTPKEACKAIEKSIKVSEDYMLKLLLKAKSVGYFATAQKEDYYEFKSQIVYLSNKEFSWEGCRVEGMK